MAVYKVPQDVEAEDKLIGPFSFRQFIYLIIAAMAGFLAYAFGQLFWALGMLPVPVTIFFLILALPLKKDQPMETYLTALVRFLLKPRLRLWDPEGNVMLVEITAVRTQEGPALKDFSSQEASERLRYLSQVIDTGGWASRGLTSATDNLTDTIVAEAQSAPDILDTTGNVSQAFDSMISRSDEQRRDAMLQTVQQSLHSPATPPAAQPAAASAPAQTPPAAVPSTPTRPGDVAATSSQSTGHVTFNPYPSSIHQKVIRPGDAVPSAPPRPQPTARQTPTQPQASSEDTISPDIIRLATNNDLSISTIAREAERLQKKHLEDEEVVVSLR